VEQRPPLRSALVVFAVFAGLASTASCLLTSNFDGLTGNDTTSSGASTGSHASSSGGIGGSGGTPTSSTETGGTSVSTGGAGGAGGGPCMQKNIGGAFPATCVLDDFNRADGNPGLDWLIETAGNYTIFDHQLTTPGPTMSGGTVRPGTALWSDGLGPTQEVFVTLSHFTTDDPELELLLKAQGGAEECGSIQISYHTDHLDATYCEAGVGQFVALLPAGGVPVTFVPGDQFGARATVDGQVSAYKNGKLLKTWDATAFSAFAASGRVGLENDGAKDSLAFDDFGAGGQ
jgi:hypothetical protein